MDFFSPDLAQLLRRPHVGKPQEEFLLPPEAPEPDLRDAEAPFLPGTPETAVSRLVEEAGRVQELLDLLEAAAPNAAAPLPPELHEEHGRQITVREYLDAAKRKHARKQRAFEDHLLQTRGCGDWGNLFPFLAYPDLLRQRDTLLATSQALAGQAAREIGVLTEIAGGPGAATSGIHWADDQIGAHLEGLSREMQRRSAAYRVKFAGLVFTMQADMGGQLLRCLLSPLLQKQEAELQRQLDAILAALRQLRDIFCIAQLFRLLEFQNFRDALLAVLKELVLEQLLQTLAALLAQLQSRLLTPVLDLFEHGFLGHEEGLLECLVDPVSEAIGAACAGAVRSLNRYYQDLVADLLRHSERQSQGAIQKLQSLHEGATIGRWMAHLDQAIKLLEYYRSRLDLVGELAGQVDGFLAEKLAPTPSTLRERLADHAGYQGYSLNPDPGFRLPGSLLS